ncbi:MAG: hypothetical protein A2Y12_12890 [Planctomycetes bacterium GWF2_42_9]|nr:MAG: hypothetical protein A2Y12_12890 [Planctomycetes bacterium GWF2_42_9]
MKKNYFLFCFVLLSATYSAYADRILERPEVLQLFQQITNQPKKTWISAGTIRATHQEYKAPKLKDANEINIQIKEAVNEYKNNSNKRELTTDTQLMNLDAIPFNTRYKLLNEYTMDSSVIVKYDGERFYWEIDANSRQDSIKPDKELSGNYMTKQFDSNWNKKRIFVWDGEKYATYFLPGNHSIEDSTGTTPHSVNGPLTAGLIPWGFGKYTYDNLSNANVSAIEKTVDNQTQIELTLNNSNGSQIIFVLLPQKNYAPQSVLIYEEGNMVASRQYSDFKLIGNAWMPFTILIEAFEPLSNRLLSRDFWDIKSVDANIPQGYDFQINYQKDALIEHAIFSKTKPEIYRYSASNDTTLLLSDRMEYVSNEGAQSQNCATAALKYSMSKLGKNLTAQQLNGLVDDSNKETSLYSMKQFAESQGCYCKAVKLNIENLKNLNNCKAILYLPGKKHFVVVESIDEKYVWLVDLSNNEFFYHVDINFFDMDWNGAALLISTSQINGTYEEIAINDQVTALGQGYECTKLLQDYDVIFCAYVAGDCGGMYTEYPTRYGCQSGTGSCSTSTKIKYIESLCIIDPYFPDGCNVTGDWTSYYMRACL